MFSKAKVSLQNVEDKLRRYFGLAGEIGSNFAPDIRPSIIVGSLDDPGVAPFRGRHWMWASDENAGPAPANNGIALHCPAPVIIRRLGFMGLPANSRVFVHIYSPDETPFFAPSRSSATWVDQRTTGVERTPLQDSGFAWVLKAVGSPAFTNLNRVLAFGGTSASQGLMIPVSLHIPANGGIGFDCNSVGAGASLTLFASGQMF